MTEEINDFPKTNNKLPRNLGVYYFGIAMIIMTIGSYFLGQYLANQSNDLEDNKGQYEYNLTSQGYELGNKLTIIQIMQELGKCPQEGLVLYSGNVSMHVVALECYRQ